MQWMSLNPMGFLGGSMSGGEILVILVAMLLLFGSKKMPSMARNLGKSLENFRRASRDVTNEIMTADLDEPATKRKQPPAIAADDSADENTPAVKTSEHAVGRNDTHRA